ncbi:methyltransferase [bacterium]|nr:methyltransferase [bacterium]
MELLPQALQEYIDQHSGQEPPLMHDLWRETHLKVTMPQMVSGHVQGQVLRLFSQLIKPQNILEVGTFTGYSGLCLAEGLAAGGTLYSIEINPERSEMIERYWKKAGIWPQTKLLIGNALEIIPTLHAPFDLVFIDADKVNYPNYFDLIAPKMAKGGLLLGDNVLWSGKIIDPNKTDKDTEGLRLFNRKVQEHPDFENVIIPVRDGIMAARKTK